MDLEARIEVAFSGYLEVDATTPNVRRGLFAVPLEFKFEEAKENVRHRQWTDSRPIRVQPVLVFVLDHVVVVFVLVPGRVPTG